MKKLICVLLFAAMILGGTAASAQSDVFLPSSAQPDKIESSAVLAVDQEQETPVEGMLVVLELPELVDETKQSVVDQTLGKLIADKKDNLKEVELKDIIDLQAQEELQKQSEEETIEWDNYLIAELWKIKIVGEERSVCQIKASFDFPVDYDEASLLAFVGFVDEGSIDWTQIDVEAADGEVVIVLPAELTEKLLNVEEAVFTMLQDTQAA